MITDINTSDAAKEMENVERVLAALSMAPAVEIYIEYIGNEQYPSVACRNVSPEEGPFEANIIVRNRTYGPGLTRSF